MLLQARQSTAEVAACTTRLQWHCLQPLRKHVLAWSAPELPHWLLQEAFLIFKAAT